MSPLSRNQPARTAPAFSSPGCGSLPRPDLAAVGGQQAGNEPDQFPGYIEHDSIGDHAEPLPVAVIFSETSTGSSAPPRIPADVRVSAWTSRYVTFCLARPCWENLIDGDGLFVQPFRAIIALIGEENPTALFLKFPFNLILT